MNKNTVCLWYNHDAEEAAQFCAATFPDTTVGKVARAPSDYPDGKQGDVLTVDFTVMGIPCIGLNGGEESQGGWCTDKWGVSWQITPRVLTEALAAGGDKAKRAFKAMMPMKRIDVATIEAAIRNTADA